MDTNLLLTWSIAFFPMPLLWLHHLLCIFLLTLKRKVVIHVTIKSVIQGIHMLLLQRVVAWNFSSRGVWSINFVLWRALCCHVLLICTSISATPNRRNTVLQQPTFLVQTWKIFDGWEMLETYSLSLYFKHSLSHWLKFIENDKFLWSFILRLMILSFNFVVFNHF